MKNLLFYLLLFITTINYAQEHAWVYFNAKDNVATFMANPLTMLTQRSLDRRVRQNISLDFSDVPISMNYVNQINSQTGITVHAKSKWLNAVHVMGNEEAIRALEYLTFVDYVEFAANDLNTKTVDFNDVKDKFGELVTYNYGESENQSSQIGVDYLHENDFIGTGMQIAILDAGFPDVDNFSVFQQIRANNQILGGYDFVNRDANFYQGNSHGTSVLSTIAGFDDGNLIGTALGASFYLFITEDITSETPLEESLWVEAAERADSLGVDIINTSLGYQDFDEPKYDYIYDEMDGNTAFISRGANKAASRGILVVVAAGNEGRSATYNTIGVPADATNVFTIGAVDANDVIASFSSFGPSSDGRIKPDVCAKGRGAILVNGAGNIRAGNGTSFAAPIMAGAIACLWEAFPNKTNFEIMEYVRESAHLFANPTDQEGYGIPNLQTAFQIAAVGEVSIVGLSVFPNPVTNQLQIKTHSIVKMALYDTLGRLIVKKDWFTDARILMKHLDSGIYLLHIEDEYKHKQIYSIIKN